MKRKSIDFRELLEGCCPSTGSRREPLQVQRALPSGRLRTPAGRADGHRPLEQIGGVLHRLPGSPFVDGHEVQRFQPPRRRSRSSASRCPRRPARRRARYPRASYRTGAAAGLDQVRRLLRLEDAGISFGSPAVARLGTARVQQLDLAGRELLRATSVLPACRGERDPPQPTRSTRRWSPGDALATRCCSPRRRAHPRIAAEEARLGIGRWSWRGALTRRAPLGALEVRALAAAGYTPTIWRASRCWRTLSAACSTGRSGSKGWRSSIR